MMFEMYLVEKIFSFVALRMSLASPESLPDVPQPMKLLLCIDKDQVLKLTHQRA